MENYKLHYEELEFQPFAYTENRYLGYYRYWADDLRDYIKAHIVGVGWWFFMITYSGSRLILTKTTRRRRVGSQSLAAL